MAREPNPLTAPRLRLKPFVGVVDLSQEREITAKDLLRTRRKKKGKRGRKKKAPPHRAPHPYQSFTPPAPSPADEREVTAADILKRRPKRRF